MTSAASSQDAQRKRTVDLDEVVAVTTEDASALKTGTI